MLARLKGWRTVAFNALTGAASVALLVLGYLQTVDLSSVLSPRDALFAAVAINVANIVLRAVTTTPLGAEKAE